MASLGDPKAGGASPLPRVKCPGTELCVWRSGFQLERFMQGSLPFLFPASTLTFGGATIAIFPIRPHAWKKLWWLRPWTARGKAEKVGDHPKNWRGDHPQRTGGPTIPRTWRATIPRTGGATIPRELAGRPSRELGGRKPKNPEAYRRNWRGDPVLSTGESIVEATCGRLFDGGLIAVLRGRRSVDAVLLPRL